MEGMLVIRVMDLEVILAKEAYPYHIHPRLL
jgi:hypothetical protein